MRLLIGAAFLALFLLAFATVALGVITALRAAPPPPPPSDEDA